MKYDKEVTWTCTDPDHHQYGRKIKDGHYQFKEKLHSFDTDYEDEVEMDIVLSHYTPEEIWNHVSAYYDSMDQVNEIYGKEAEWIIAECVFEQSIQ